MKQLSFPPSTADTAPQLSPHPPSVYFSAPTWDDAPLPPEQGHRLDVAKRVSDIQNHLIEARSDVAAAASHLNVLQVHMEASQSRLRQLEFLLDGLSSV